MNEIEIGEKDNQGKDEVYCNWYKCPKCSDTMITHHQNFCGNCGIKLKWKGVVPQNTKEKEV